MLKALFQIFKKYKIIFQISVFTQNFILHFSVYTKLFFKFKILSYFSVKNCYNIYYYYLKHECLNNFIKCK